MDYKIIKDRFIIDNSINANILPHIEAPFQWGLQSLIKYKILEVIYSGVKNRESL